MVVITLGGLTMHVLLVLTVLVVAAPNRPPILPPKVNQTPQHQIVGDWLCEKINGGGVDGRNLVFRITPSETIFLVNGQTSQGDGLTATYAVDFTKNPIVITFMPRQRGG